MSAASSNDEPERAVPLDDWELELRTRLMTEGHGYFAASALALYSRSMLETYTPRPFIITGIGGT
jgi:hypothetical protein